MFSGMERPSHWVVLAVVVLLLFGYKKLPDITRSVGRSLRIFKTEMKGLNDDDSARDAAEKPAETEAAPPPVQAPPAPPAPGSTLITPTPPVPVVSSVPIVAADGTVVDNGNAVNGASNGAHVNGGVASEQRPQS
ncbi:MAG: twin-arginine translocation protein TatA/E family subunit [Frankiales bacterium]|nr:twin-arginine translocation protein TatA/E family subunit [Frankiales bacterium]